VGFKQLCCQLNSKQLDLTDSQLLSAHLGTYSNYYIFFCIFMKPGYEFMCADNRLLWKMTYEILLRLSFFFSFSLSTFFILLWFWIKANVISITLDENHLKFTV